MKELSRLATVCAQRQDVLLQIYEGFAYVYVGNNPERGSMVARCNDSDAVTKITYELCQGKYSIKAGENPNKVFLRKAA